MKNRISILLIGILAVLIIILVIQNFTSDKLSVSDSLMNIYPELNTSSVSMINAYKTGYPDSGLVFSKLDGKWIINNYFNAPAKETEIDKLLGDVSSLQGEIRSTSQGLLADYEITDETALHVEFLTADSSEIVHALIGKGVPQQAQSGFVRNASSDTVYLVNNNFLSRFAVWNAEPFKKMPAKRWANLKMTELDKDQITAMEIQVGNTAYKFEKSEIPPIDSASLPEKVWVQVSPSKGKVLDDALIKPIVNRVARMTASEIVGTDIKNEYDLTDSKYKTIITTADSHRLTLTFGAEVDTTGKSLYAMVDSSPVVYQAAKYNYEALFVNPFKAQ